jgi:vancomycin permeability regulator SanA
MRAIYIANPKDIQANLSLLEHLAQVNSTCLREAVARIGRLNDKRSPTSLPLTVSLTMFWSH